MFWNAVEKMIDTGYTAKLAFNRVFSVHGLWKSNQNILTLIKDRMMKIDLL